MRNASTATTQTLRSGPGGRLLSLDQVISSPESGLQYRIERAARRGRVRAGVPRASGSAGRPRSPRRCASRSATRIDGWLREAYFGQLLDGHPRAIRVFDAFPLVRPTAGVPLLPGARVRAPRRPARVTCTRAGRAGRRRSVRREIAGILEVLGKLHRGQMLHRDLTPLNVFVCEGPRLKLGDFGIVAPPERPARHHRAHHEHDDRAERASWTARCPKWQARDDVYQVGQLLGMLVQRRRGRAHPHERRARPARAAIISRRSSTAASASAASATRAPTS